MKLTLLLLISTISFALVGQDCHLDFSGTVFSANGDALIGATLYVQELQRGTATDNSGAFKLTALCPGTYHIEIKYLGYQEQTIVISLSQNLRQPITLQEIDALLGEVVIEEKFQHVRETQNYSALAGRALDESRGKSLGEALRDLPGVSSIQAGPSVFKPVIHGVHSQRILILNNGIRQEGQQWGAEHAPEIDPFIASNIVVIKDATAIKYGTDALGGVIIVNPPDLPEKPGLGGELNIIGQSNGRSGTVSGTVEGGVKGFSGFGWRAQGTAKRAGDFHAPDYNLSNTGFKELNFSLAAGIHKEKQAIDIFFSHFQSTLGILRGSGTGNNEDLQNAIEREPPQYTTDFTYHISSPRQEVSHELLKINAHRHTTAGVWRFQYGFQYNARKEFDVRRSALNDIPSINLQLSTHTLDFELEHTLSEKIQGSVGINGMMQINNNVAGTQRIPFIPDFNNVSAGIFWIEKITAGKWLVDIGTRYDFRVYDVAGFDFKNTFYTSKLHFGNFSGTAGASRTFAHGSRFTTTLGSTWRPPHVAELYSLGTHQSAGAIEFGLLLDKQTNEVNDISSVNFKTEQAIKWVNSYRVTRDRFEFEVAGYINFIFNYIFLKPGGVTETIRGVYPYFRYTQTDASFIGADVSGAWTIQKDVRLSAGASLLRAKDETQDDFLIFIPSNHYDIGARYDHPDKERSHNFFVESKVRYVARQNRAPRVVTVREINEATDADTDPFAGDTRNFDFVAAPKAYAVWSVTTGMSFKMKSSRCDLRLSVANLLNTSYREYTNRFRYYSDDLGRNFSLAAKYSF